MKANTKKEIVLYIMQWADWDSDWSDKKFKSVFNALMREDKDWLIQALGFVNSDADKRHENAEYAVKIATKKF